MKILFAGGGTGGHIYPIMAVAEKLRDIAQEDKILNLELFYISDTPYDQRALDDNQIKFYELKTGKRRVYFSFENYFDIFKTFFATIRAIFLVYKIFPDVIFSKGGYPSVPVTIAARVLDIPLIIHESDSVPGRANLMAGKWAQKIAISFKEASNYFTKEKTAFVGPIVRNEVRTPLKDGAFEYLKLRSVLPVIFVIGGSQGAKIINDCILDGLPDMVQKYQIIHQTGVKNFEEVKGMADIILKDIPDKENYYPYPYLNKLALRMSAGVANIVISRAGASSIGEIASWGKPSIIIPITKSNGDHQRNNAFNYAQTGACVVIEESNLKSHVLVSEIDRILGDANLQNKMSEATKVFVFPDAEEKIAREIITMALQHER
jgi:UDP-N-acetylglucosamine--N-acetylmuramyl-(pentapeptide) pyrophosphoryl-undecaprenol N-acetylglucosamine transferase